MEYIKSHIYGINIIIIFNLLIFIKFEFKKLKIQKNIYLRFRILILEKKE